MVRFVGWFMFTVAGCCAALIALDIYMLVSLSIGPQDWLFQHKKDRIVTLFFFGVLVPAGLGALILKKEKSR